MIEDTGSSSNLRAMAPWRHGHATVFTHSHSSLDFPVAGTAAAQISTTIAVMPRFGSLM